MDYVDCLQLHAVNDASHLEEVMADGGALSYLEKAKEQGLIKHIGIHKCSSIH